ncbi:MAG: hypothetical protein P8016_13905 [Sedimentisphaerales bacterium]
MAVQTHTVGYLAINRNLFFMTGVLATYIIGCKLCMIYLYKSSFDDFIRNLMTILAVCLNNLFVIFRIFQKMTGVTGFNIYLKMLISLKVAMA